MISLFALLVFVGIFVSVLVIANRHQPEIDMPKEKAGKLKHGASDLHWQDDAPNGLVQQLVETALEHSPLKDHLMHAGLVELNEATGVTTKLYAGEFDEAVRAYQDHMNVDMFTARDAVTDIAKMLNIPLADDAQEPPQAKNSDAAGHG